LIGEANTPGPSDVTRRSFLGTLTLGATALAAGVSGAAGAEAPDAPKPKLSAVGEAQLRDLLARRGGQFTAAQKADLERLLIAMEKTGQTLRDFPLEENSEPAILFRVWRKEK